VEYKRLYLLPTIDEKKREGNALSRFNKLLGDDAAIYRSNREHKKYAMFDLLNKRGRRVSLVTIYIIT